ncbi:MAG: response regulator [Sulfuricella sp.]|nr:response regulator [Sulfuricella sp.]
MNKNHTRILIVDDDARNVKLLEAMLLADGYATLSAASGEESLRVAAAELPGLILMDVMMPGMNGFETTEKLKSNPTTLDIPVIMVTSLDDRESRLYAMQAGADEFVSKPVDRAELSLRVRNVLMLNECRRLMARQA